MEARPSDVLEFWFGDGDRDDPALGKQQAKLWWSAHADVDAEIARRFGEVHERACRGEFDDWADTPHGRLALVIVLDQFSRNLHRNSPEAFAQDRKAQALTLEGLERGDDRDLARLERAFFYMPLEHAEDVDLQRRCLACFEGLRDDLAPDHAEAGEYWVDFARRHATVIERFGRFPHRNAVLGRESTTEELEHLEKMPGGF